MSRLPEKFDRTAAARAYKQGATANEVAKQFSISRRTVFRLGVAKQLTIEQRAQIVLAHLMQGKSKISLARDHGVSRRTVLRICALVTCIMLMLNVPGCSSTTNVRPLKAAKPEAPPLALPTQLRQRNWEVVGESGRKEGSCVYASLTTVARWCHRPTLAKWLSDPSVNGGGEYSGRLRKKLDANGVPYAFTEAASAEFLDYCHATRRGCILWWKERHCCTFAGFVEIEGRVFAAIIDNNHPETYELTERSAFLRAWASFGGFGLTLLYSPASPRPWLSYTDQPS